MSYIYNTCACEICGGKIDYVWQLADGVFDRVPDREKYVFAASNKIYTKYEVCVRCSECKTIACFEYSLDGKYIGKRG